jgi:DNA-binding transcriptional MerR regulator
MDVLLSIGDFSKMTYLSVKALRHYHDVGLLEPADIDPVTGYRRYALGQVATAQAIRRFRDLDMPIDEVRRVLRAPDEATRNRAILAHLERMQTQLEQTQQAVASLQALLAGAPATAAVEIRRIPATRALAVQRVVEFSDSPDWLYEAYDWLHGLADTHSITITGCDSAIYADELFEEGVGTTTAYVAIAAGGGVPAAAASPVADTTFAVLELPAITAAVLVHDGPFSELDQAYAALGAIVAERGIGGPGPVREHYLSATSTEVCWPTSTTTGATP